MRYTTSKGSLDALSGATPEAEATPPEQTPETTGWDRSIVDPVVVRNDALPVRCLRAWQRSGRPEGRKHERNPVRGAIMLAAIVALAIWAPGMAVFIGILSVLVFVHELGHYVAARWAGMKPTDFFVGFGPTVWSETTRSGLRYGLKVIPAGGYVKIPGMGPREEVEASLEPFTYRAATRGRRLVVILAGIAVNLALAAALFAGYAATQEDAGAWQAASTGVGQTTEVATGTLAGLGNLVTGAQDYARSIADGQVPENRMVSPIGGAQLADGLLDSSPAKLVLLAAIFSASLALLNLLPLLPLDGGHAFLVVIEGIWSRLTGRRNLRIDPNRFTPAAIAVLVVLLGVSASAMYLDLLHPLTQSVR